MGNLWEPDSPVCYHGSFSGSSSSSINRPENLQMRTENSHLNFLQLWVPNFSITVKEDRSLVLKDSKRCWRITASPADLGLHAQPTQSTTDYLICFPLPISSRFYTLLIMLAMQKEYPHMVAPLFQFQLQVLVSEHARRNRKNVILLI